MVNLSRKGCTMQTDTPIPHGEILRLRIYERDGRGLFEIDVAVVRFMVEQSVGIEFVRIQEREMERLERILVNLCTGRHI